MTKKRKPAARKRGAGKAAKHQADKTTEASHGSSEAPAVPPADQRPTNEGTQAPPHAARPGGAQVAVSSPPPANENAQGESPKERTSPHHGPPYRLIPRSVYLGQETMEAYSIRRAAEAAADRAKSDAKAERFRLLCERVIHHFANPDVRRYWLTQIEPLAGSGEPSQVLRGGLKWPEDKASVYAILALCSEGSGYIEIMPESIRNTQWYKINGCCATEVERYDNMASDLLAYVERDLWEQGLLSAGLPDISKKGPHDKTSLDEIDWAIVLLIQETRKKEGRIPSYNEIAASLAKSGATAKQLTKQAISDRVRHKIKPAGVWPVEGRPAKVQRYTNQQIDDSVSDGEADKVL